MREYDELLARVKEVKPHKQIYNFLDVIGKPDDENIMSSWLAFILDSEKIGSDKPLELLCSYLHLDPKTKTVETFREYCLKNQRRIDILLKTEEIWIVIENKINSFECNEQTRDYVKELSDEIGGRNIAVRYIYLKPNYNKSLPADKTFEVMTYGKLFEIFKGIKEEDFTNKANYFFFAEYMRVVKEKYAMNQELKFEPEVEIYTKYQIQFRTIEKSLDSAGKIVREKLLSALKEIFPPEEDWVVHPLSLFIQIYKNAWPQGIHYEIGTWFWQKQWANISFERLIGNKVVIDYCLHAEGQQGRLYLDSIKKLECDKTYFCSKDYDFGDERNCMNSIAFIAQHLLTIKKEFTEKIDCIGSI